MSVQKCTFAIGGCPFPISKSIEVIGSSTFKLPPLPFGLMNHSTIVTNDKKLMTIGGTHIFDFNGDPTSNIRSRQCFVLQGTKWICHSMLLQPRNRSISICMPNGIYVFGGSGESFAEDSLSSSEFLATGTTNWREGPRVPQNADFLSSGHGVAISETELVLMGGTGKSSTNGYASKQIWKFNTITEEWHLIGNMKVARFDHQAAFLNGKIIISGGRTYDSLGGLSDLKSTEIIDPNQVDVDPLLVGNLNVPRNCHVMGMISKNAIPTVVAIGGINIDHGNLDSIEEWDSENRKWKLLEQKLFEKRSM